MFLDNALLFATRRMMSSGAMTCPIRQPVRGLGPRGSTNLSLRQEVREEIMNVVIGGVRPNNQQRADSEEGTGLDEHGDDGLAQSANSANP